MGAFAAGFCAPFARRALVPLPVFVILPVRAWPFDGELTVARGFVSGTFAATALVVPFVAAGPFLATILELADPAGPFPFARFLAAVVVFDPISGLAFL